MEKFIVIKDIKSTSAWQNVNARLLYLHIACSMDVVSRIYARSVRGMAADTGLSVAAIRHALEALEAARLIAIDTTHLATQPTTQPTTHVLLLAPNKLETPNDTPNDTPSNTANDTDINNKNKQKEASHTHRVRACAEEGRRLLIEEYNVTATAATSAVKSFFRWQNMKGKEWESDGDCLAHLLAWCEKRLPRKRLETVDSLDDTQRRAEERTRTEEAMKATDEEKRAWEEVQKVYRWMKEAEERGDADGVRLQSDAYERLRAEFVRKYREKSTN